MATETLRTVCNRDCPDACGLVATVEDGRLVRLGGDPDHPVTQGLPLLAHVAVPCAAEFARPADDSAAPRRRLLPRRLLGRGARGRGRAPPRHPQRSRGRRRSSTTARAARSASSRASSTTSSSCSARSRSSGATSARARATPRRRPTSATRSRTTSSTSRSRADPPLGKEPVHLERPPPAGSEGGAGAEAHASS